MMELLKNINTKPNLNRVFFSPANTPFLLYCCIKHCDYKTTSYLLLGPEALCQDTCNNVFFKNQK